MTFFTYILKSGVDSKYYYGQTQNLEKRLSDHNNGKSKYTMKYIPWKLFAFKACGSRKEAMKFERMLKNIHHKDKIHSFLVRHKFNLLNV